MRSVAVQPRLITHIHLRVRDLARAETFYRQCFGLVSQRCDHPAGPARYLQPASDDRPAPLCIVLVAGLPSSAELTGMDHFSLEVPSVRDVEAVYQAVIAAGWRATRPRRYDGHYQTFVFDPDGYKVEVLTYDQDAREPVGCRQVAVNNTDREEQDRWQPRT